MAGTAADNEVTVEAAFLKSEHTPQCQIALNLKNIKLRESRPTGT